MLINWQIRYSQFSQYSVRPSIPDAAVEPVNHPPSQTFQSDEALSKNRRVCGAGGNRADRGRHRLGAGRISIDVKRRP